MRLKWLRLLVPVARCSPSPSRCPSCGGDDGGDDERRHDRRPEEFAPVTAAPDDAQEGGELTVLAAGDIDYMDPGAAYYQFTYMVTWRPSARCSAGSRTTQGADAGPGRRRAARSPTTARRSPSRSSDGVRYSPPVDREVTAADVEYAIERSLLPGRGERLHRDLPRRHRRLRAGRRQAVDRTRRRRAGHRAASQTPDDQTLVFELDQPRSRRQGDRRRSRCRSARRCRRSTRRSSTPRTPRPTASTSSSPAPTWSRTTPSRAS